MDEFQAEREFGKRIFGSPEQLDQEVRRMFANNTLAYAVERFCQSIGKSETDTMKAVACVLARRHQQMVDEKLKWLEQETVLTVSGTPLDHPAVRDSHLAAVAG